jgi:hypothetical protein
VAQEAPELHDRIADRIRGLLTELGEPCVPPEDTA